MGNWIRKILINRLLIKRAGLIAECQANEICKEIDPTAHRMLGEIEEELRQLGWVKNG